MLTQKLSLKNNNKKLCFLRWSEGSHIEQREIQSFISIGRDKQNIIALNDICVSRRHCRIQKQEKEGFILQDMDSENGTLLNGSRVFKAVLQNYDTIQIGNTEFIFSFEKLNEQESSHTKSLNARWNQQLQNLPAMAKSNMPVLISGPSGTGKEMLAKLIHHYSHRNKEPMISINCGALSESLIESEFFGHIKGSYTGAVNTRKGAFMAAKGGSLFLDEIGDLPLSLQPKLLRALEYQEIKAVGSDVITKTDVRIIAATHQDLIEKVKNKTFRTDLYFRLCVLNISPPALKDRMEDFDNFMQVLCHQYGIAFSPQAITLLKQHSWSGNIRELKNTVARAKALFSGELIGEDKIEQLIYIHSSPLKPSINSMLKTEVKINIDSDLSVIKTIEKNLITQSMSAHKGNQKRVSADLKMPASTLSEKIKKYKINPKDYKIKLVTPQLQI